MKILIGGDLVINNAYSADLIDKEIDTLFQTSKLNIVNLEAPVTKSNQQAVKTGPYLKSNEQATKEVLHKLNINLVTLANNHLKDYGEIGVSDTIDFLFKNQIDYVGAGMKLEDAQRVKYILLETKTIAIINVAENEWSNASENEAGANPLNTIDNFYQINDAKSKSDYLIVIVHGGNEYYNLPSPRVQQLFRFFADAGADLVVGHHTHCISGFELYNNVPIYYSLGNFLFTKASKHDDWYTGAILEVKISDNVLSSHIIFIRQNKETYQLSLLKEEEEAEVRNKFLQYNSIISNSAKLKHSWDEFIASKYNLYLNYWSAKSQINNKIAKKLFNILKIDLINKKGASLYLNLMRCEAHYDLSKQILKKYISK